MSWQTVCKIDDIPYNAGACALVNGKQIAIFALQGQYFALDNHDPFSGANVLSRGILCDLAGQLCVASPVYKQHFALANGQCLEDASVCLRAYPVRCQGEVLEVNMA